ncbi:MAG TPA: GntR family transcriptional regulator [Hyphomicrobiaceae bacterium]|nr:GntR family transcriptional regulator [Hyphomicrobiaceae bacterium]
MSTLELIAEAEAGAAGRALAQRVTLNAFEPEPMVPLHHQVTTDLAMQLRLGRWAAGAIIPSEQELCAHYGVSRGTVRRALESLARDGIIERHPGRGSFLCRPKSEGQIAGSYTRFRIEGPPLDAGGRILSFSRRRPSPEIAEVLSLRRSEQIFRFDRIRFVKQTPVALQLSFVPERICPRLTAKQLQENHLIDVLRDRFGIEFTHADEYIEPALADDYVAQHLTLVPNTPIFQLERRTYLADGRVGEFRRAVMRGDIYRYKVELR